MRRTKGFTLIELLVVIAIIALLISILVPSLTRARALAYRAKCMANVRGIGQAIGLYKAENDDQYPLISNTEGMNPNDAMISGGSDDVFALDGDASGAGTGLNVNENLCLLKSGGMVPWKMFRCPAVSSDIMDRAATGNNDFGFKDTDDQFFYDYAYHNGYRSLGSGGRIYTNLAPFGSVLSSDFIIYGDQPGEEIDVDFEHQAEPGLGYNHGDDGIVVLNAGLNTRFSSKTILAGQGKEERVAPFKDIEKNVYVNNDGAADKPADKHDTVLIKKN